MKASIPDRDPMANISEIKGETASIDLVVKVISINQKEANTKKGPMKYYYGIIGDQTGTIPFTAWSMASSVRAGDVLELKNCTVKLYNERARVYVESKSQVILRPGEDLEVKRTYPSLKVKELSLRDPYVTVEGIVREIKERPYNGKEKSGTLYFGYLEDDTGSIRLNAFDVKLKEGQGVRIKGARVSEYNNRLRISLNDKTETETIKLSISQVPKVYDLCELDSPVSGIATSGFVVSAGEKGGLVMRCPECRKTPEGDSCPDHPEAKLIKDYFIFFTIDDGTGTIQCTAGKDQIDGIMKMAGGEALEEMASRDPFLRELKQNLLGRLAQVTGEVIRSRNGLSFRTSSINIPDSESIDKMVRAYADEMEV